MKNVLLPKAIKLNKDRKQRKWWQRAVRVMAMAVVFCTTYALILPAITMEGEPVCGTEAHTHVDGCYTEKPVTVYVCGLETDLHTHSAICYAQSKSPVCQYVHTHSDSCAAVSKTVLTCTLEESQGHVHSDSCAVTEQVKICTLEESAPHTHTEVCTAPAQVKTCTLEETADHTHGDSCYTVETRTVCTRSAEGHTHGEGCYETKTVYCETPESGGHAHTEACYEIRQVPCDLTVNDGHVHEESCYVTENKLVCTIPGEAPHVHLDTCLQETGETEKVLTCELEEHTHTDSCYPLEENETESEYLCGMGVHTHREECRDAEGNLVCTIPEHTHEAACLVEDLDLTADVETAQDWADMFAELTLTGKWPEDLLAVANIQLGYQESEKNVVLEDGVLKGYTRYGAWYGTPYGSWNESFVSFCLHFAGIDTFPTASDCESWIEKLTEAERYAASDVYTPKPGDLIFFDFEQRTAEEEAPPITPDRVGIVAELIEATEEEPAKIKTIQGDCDGEVSEVTYDQADVTIIGYGILPEHGYVCGLEVHAHTEICCDETGAIVCTLEEHDHSEVCYEQAQEEEIPLTLPLICTLEEHTHSAQCFGAAAGTEASCGKTEHTHSDACYGAATASFPYEDDRITMTVNVSSTKGLPEGLTMEVLLLNPEDQTYVSYEDYAMENAGSDLFDLTGYRIRFCYEGKEIELADAEITADLTVKPVEYRKPEAVAFSETAAAAPMLLTMEDDDVPMAAMFLAEEDETEDPAGEETEGSTEEKEPDLLLVTLLQEDGGDIIDSGSASFSGTGAEGTQMTLSLTSARSFALASRSVVNPEFQVEFYANIPIYRTYDSEPSGVSLPLINTKGAGDGTGGSLPKNTGSTSSTGTTKGILYLQLEAVSGVTTTENPNGTGDAANGKLYQVHTENELRMIYNTDTKTYVPGITLEHMDKLQNNSSYTLSKVRVSQNNGSTWTDYTSDLAELTFTNNTNPTDGSIPITANTIIRLVYDTTEGIYNNAANIFDYDITTTSFYRNSDASGTAYATHDAAKGSSSTRVVYQQTAKSGAGVGINSAWLNSKTTKLAFGNANTGIPYQNQTITLDGYSNTPNIFNSNGYKGCTFGLVTGYNYAEDRLTYTTNLNYQALFNDEAYYREEVTGKTPYYSNALNFERTGDTYVLSGVNSDGAIAGVQDTKLNYFFSPQSYTHIYTNNFWPVDGTVSDTTSGHDMLTGNKSTLQYRMRTNGSTTGRFPESDDGTYHNSYFGMQFAVEFQLDGQYCGPLEYLFYGDDDMWVFLTDIETGVSTKICDIGGVHSSVGSITDLWDYIPKNTKGNYALTVFYTERGASGSSCYIEFTLPQVTSITQNTPTTGSVTVGKETVDETDPNATYDFRFDLAATAQSSVGLNDNYSYTITDGTTVQTGSIASGGTFRLKAHEKITITGIPEGLKYTFTELFAEGADKNYNINWSDGTAGHALSGTVERNKTHTFTCTNHAAGSLAITKTVLGTPKDTYFKMDVTLVDADDAPLSGTFSGIAFVDGKAEVEVEAGKTVTITNIPVGTKWTVQEQEISGYQISYNVDGQKTDTTPTGTIAHATTVNVEVVNAVEYVLPNTGGSGILLFTLGGLLMMAAACVCYVNKIGRKRQKGGAG